MSSLEPPSSPAAPEAAPEPTLVQRKNSLVAWLRSLVALRPASLREDLQEALEEEANGDSAEFSVNERAILQNVLKLGNLKVDDVSVPRSDIEAVEASQTMGHLIARFRLAGHSRLPVYEENLDHIIGFVHVKDALRAVTAPGTDPEKSIPVRLLTPVLRQKLLRADIVRDVVFVPPQMPVAELLQQMQSTRVHMAVVIDEYGGTDGLVTIEDLLEAVVGEIDDEHDDADQLLVRAVGDNTFIADARAELEELQEVIGPDFNPGALGEDVDTLGGLIFDLVDRVPRRGEVVSELAGFDFEILAADARRVKKVKITRLAGRRHRETETPTLALPAPAASSTDDEQKAAE